MENVSTNGPSSGHFTFFSSTWKPSIFPGKTEAVLSSLAYSICSVLMILCNKGVSGVFDSTWTLVFFQTFCATVLHGIGMSFGIIENTGYSFAKLGLVLPLNFFFVIMLYTNMQAILHLSIPMIMVYKNLSTFLTVVGDYFAYDRSVACGEWWSLVCMLAGAVAASFYDLDFNLAGCLWITTNSIVQALYSLYAKFLQNSKQMSPTSLSIYNNFTSCVVLMFVYSMKMVICGGVSVTYCLKFGATGIGYVQLILLMSSGIMGTLLGTCSFWCISASSPSNFAVVGALNKIPTTLFGALLFEVHIDNRGWIFIVMNMIGGFGYAITHSYNCEKIWNVLITCGNIRPSIRLAYILVSLSCFVSASLYLPDVGRTHAAMEVTLQKITQISLLFTPKSINFSQKQNISLSSFTKGMSNFSQNISILQKKLKISILTKSLQATASSARPMLTTETVPSEKVLSVEGVAVWNVGFVWNRTKKTWSGLGRFHQSCNMCGYKMCPPHPKNSIAYAWNASDKGSFVPLEVPIGVRSENIGEPKWIHMRGHGHHPSILCYTNGNPTDQSKFAFDPKMASTKSSYNNYVIDTVDSLTITNVKLVQYAKLIDPPNKTAKNFLYFPHGNETYMVTLVEPHTIYKWNDDGIITFQYSTPCSKCSYGGPRYLSAGPVYVPGRGWLASGHSGGTRGGRNYRMSYFYVFRDSPPFDVLCHTAEISFGYSKFVEYLVYMDIIDDYLYISMGVSDCYSVLIKLPLKNILARCKSTG